jgi:hypothetical protein
MARALQMGSVSDAHSMKTGAAPRPTGSPFAFYCRDGRSTSLDSLAAAVMFAVLGKKGEAARMRAPGMSFQSLALCLAGVPIGSSEAHPGGLNSQGCHNNRKTGGYHCHRGSQATTTDACKKEVVALGGASRLVVLMSGTGRKRSVFK